MKVESKYGAEYTSMIIDTLGIDLPYMASDKVECELSTDGVGDPMVCLYLQFNDPKVDLDQKTDEYAQICLNEGYEVTYRISNYNDPTGMGYYEIGTYYADYEIDEVNAVELQILNNGSKLGIFAYNYVITSPDSWPTNLVTYLLGHDIPHLEDSNYVYDSEIKLEANVKYIEIVIDGATYEDEEAYKQLLINNNYLIDEEEYEEYGYFAYSSDKKHALQFKFDIDYNVFVIFVYTLSSK